MKKGSALPSFVQPALATLVSEPPSDAHWLHEIKFDGYRIQARIDEGEVRLLTRKGLDWTHRFSAVAHSLVGLSISQALLDGEAVVLDERGASDFVQLVEAIKSGHSEKIVFYAFDLIYVDGVDIRSLPLVERKQRLQDLLRTSRKKRQFRYSDHVLGPGQPVLAEACRIGLEGIISKRSQGPYRSGRHSEWLKSKCRLNDEFVIVGFLDSKAVKQAVGALVLGYFDKAKLIYAGRVGTGFSIRCASELWQRLRTLQMANCPVDRSLLTPIQVRGVNWVQPELVAQVEYRGWTSDGLLRQAAFKALRQDKPAKEVGRPTQRLNK